MPLQEEWRLFADVDFSRALGHFCRPSPVGAGRAYETSDAGGVGPFPLRRQEGEARAVSAGMPRAVAVGKGRGHARGEGERGGAAADEVTGRPWGSSPPVVGDIVVDEAT